jgi:hypothetical protein
MHFSNSLPYPIARLREEIAEEDPDWKFRALIKAFAGFLVLLSSRKIRLFRDDKMLVHMRINVTQIVILS